MTVQELFSLVDFKDVIPYVNDEDVENCRKAYEYIRTCTPVTTDYELHIVWVDEEEDGYYNVNLHKVPSDGVTCAIGFSSLNEVAGYKITKQECFARIAVSEILYEATWWGYDNETISNNEKAISKQLEEAKQSVDKGEAMSYEEFLKRINLDENVQSED